MSYKRIAFFSLLITLPIGQRAVAQFAITSEEQAVSIVYEASNTALDSIAAHLLADDIEAVSGYRPQLYTGLHEVNGNVIIIGDIGSDLIRKYIDAKELEGKWESYVRVHVSDLADGIKQALIIAGSDPRGMAYGVFELSEEIGVSPWYWWADVPVKKKHPLIVSTKRILSDPPTVKYRGVFLNDEGWGLEPWSSKTFEQEAGNIGPKTYAKVFELLLRLKANMLWPAMHPNTTPFFVMPGNTETAKQWEIVVGSSHAEAMLRNNVGEWDQQTMGAFNYQSNEETVKAYWQQRVEESAGMEAIFTVGMRGIHDSGMEGADSMDDKVAALERVINDQRDMLRKFIDEDIAEVPQSFTPYKEVLDIYESGMKVPEDIIITWPDDNYGHIRRFSNKEEQQRSGGGGIYYHLSYLGSPHPYLLFSSASPAKTWREMKRAALHGMTELWVVNVGDLKRREWETEFFLDLAWDINSWKAEQIGSFYRSVAARDLSTEYANDISDLMWEYRRLAAERKPELMGFNQPQWAGWPPIKDPEFSLWHYGDEVEKRLHSYNKINNRAARIYEEISQEVSDAYFQLVYFPIAGAAALNEKVLYAYKSREYAKQGRADANSWSDSAFTAYNRLMELTRMYNEDIAMGKWAYSVDPTPGYKKGSSVFFEPITTRVQTEKRSGIGVAIEGMSGLLQPVRGGLPAVFTNASIISLESSEVTISGELERASDTTGSYIYWPENGVTRIIPGPDKYDVIPYEVDSETIAVFTFEHKLPGGVHTLQLKVDHPDPEKNSWWVTLNDHAPVLAKGNDQLLKVGDFVLNRGTNRLVIHPHESGGKLYGAELLQESRTFNPQFTGNNQLPAFSGMVQQEYFIDIFSFGEGVEAWSAEVGEPWIELSESNGVLNGNSERIWVSINKEMLPEDKISEGMIEISSRDYRYQVEVVVHNPDVNATEGAFVETNGVISIPAHAYSGKWSGSTAEWQTLQGLGRSGSAMIIQPLDSPYIPDRKRVKTEAPKLEYEIVVTDGGMANLIIEAVPAFSSDQSQTLRLAVSVDDSDPEWITFDMEKNWTNIVSQNRMSGDIELTLEPGSHSIQLWGTDPSVNPDKIIIDFGGLKPSYSGPGLMRYE